MKKLILISALLLFGSSGWAEELFFECVDNRLKCPITVIFSVNKTTEEHTRQPIPNSCSKFKKEFMFTGKNIWTTDFLYFDDDKYGKQFGIKRDSLTLHDGRDDSKVIGQCKIVEKNNIF